MDAEDMAAALRSAARDCSERGLSSAAKWASELLLSMPQRIAIHPSLTVTSTPARSRSPRTLFPVNTPGVGGSGEPSMSLFPERHPHAPTMEPLPSHVRAHEEQLEAFDEDAILAAKALMDTKEYTRAVHFLKDCKSAKATFLSVYSQYLASEKTAIRDWYRLDNNKQQPPVPINAELVTLLQVVQNATDPWLLFLKALFLRRLSRREEAIESALCSIANYPWNWSTWMLLGECLGDGEELSSIMPLLPLPTTHPLVQMFQIKILNGLNNPTDNELALCDRLLQEDLFPKSLWIMSLRACVLYHIHDFSQAEVQFKKLLSIDPYRIDDIDIYSNILYVTENKLELSKLAHDFLALDKDRPEVCCLVGNHYSLRAEHEKAIKYFRRATQLDRTYLSAWTLMGHEYVEMKNSHAAIEAYRKAVDVNKKDYRAWFGLGQAYELLSMHQYALYYYQHATSLRPYDVRIWQAQGMCYQEMNRLREAIECLKRALIGADPHETSIRTRLAGLHNDLSEFAEAASYHKYIVDTLVADNRPVNEYAASSVYVAKYHCQQGGGDLELAKAYMERVASSNSASAIQAADLLKRIKSEMAKVAASVAAKIESQAGPSASSTDMQTDSVVS